MLLQLTQIPFVEKVLKEALTQEDKVLVNHLLDGEIRENELKISFFGCLNSGDFC